MPDSPAEDLIETLAALPDDDGRDRMLRDLARTLREAPDLAADLTGFAARDADGPRLQVAAALLSGILDEARMSIENGLRGPEATLKAVEARLAELDRAGALPQGVRIRLAQIYVRAGLEPPALARLSADAPPADGMPEDGAPGEFDLDGLLEEVRRAAEGEPLRAHAVLQEMTAVMPADMRGSLAERIAARPGNLETRLARYWLLDRVPEMRLAAARAIGAHAAADGLDAETASLLPAVRKWLPADAAREALDAAVKAVLRRGGASAPRTSWKIHRALATLPDGAGGQSVAAAVQRGGRREVAMLLFKQGQGIKDAFMLPCAGAGEQKRILGLLLEEVDAIDIEPEHVARSIAFGLGDVAAQDHPPAPGLVDMAPIWGEAAPSPLPSDAASILEAIGAEPRLSELSARARSKLIADSEGWVEAHPHLETWFEDTTELRERLDRARTDNGREKAVRDQLKARRDWWARQMAISAATLKARAGGEDPLWLSFAAAAQALAGGRQLGRIPVMERIVAMTLAAHDARTGEMPGGWAWAPAGEEDDLAALARMLSRPEAFVEGYLTALAISPEAPSAQDWITPLLGDLVLEGEGGVEHLLELLTEEANRLNDETAEPALVARQLAGLDAAGARDWAEGFAALLDAARREWPARRLSTEDKRVLRGIRDVAKGADAAAVRAVLPEWIAQRHARRR